MKNIFMNPIGIVKSTRKDPDDDHWDIENALIELDSNQFGPEALSGLIEFSHVQIIFYMDQVDPLKIEKSARHPRNNQNWPKVGIFSQRGKNRPNQIGITICKILKIEERSLHLKGLDAIDGTPILDIKPWARELGPREEIQQPSWITELMRDYWI